jgi:hypothetical protein
MGLGSEIRKKNFSGSRNQGQKAPDLGSGSATLMITLNSGPDLNPGFFCIKIHFRLFLTKLTNITDLQLKKS